MEIRWTIIPQNLVFMYLKISVAVDDRCLAQRHDFGSADRTKSLFQFSNFMFSIATPVSSRCHEKASFNWVSLKFNWISVKLMTNGDPAWVSKIYLFCPRPNDASARRHENVRIQWISWNIPWLLIEKGNFWALSPKPNEQEKCPRSTSILQANWRWRREVGGYLWVGRYWTRLHQWGKWQPRSFDQRFSGLLSSGWITLQKSAAESDSRWLESSPLVTDSVIWVWQSLKNTFMFGCSGKHGRRGKKNRKKKLSGREEVKSRFLLWRGGGGWGYPQGGNQ